MDKKQLIDHLKQSESSLEWREIKTGVAVEFSDGNDAWVLTLKDLNKWQTPEIFVEEFRQIDEKRSKVIIALKNWQLQLPGKF